MVEFSVRDFLQKQFSKEAVFASAKKLEKYFVLPFFGDQSLNLQRDVSNLIAKFYPFLDPRIVLRNQFSIGTFFRYKDRLPKSCHSGVIYEFSCASCQASYVGSTYQRLFTRVAQHQGRSHRTGQMLSNPSASSIRDHAMSCNAPFSIDNFSILGTNNCFPDLRILESLYISRQRPQINDSTSAYPLHVSV